MNLDDGCVLADVPDEKNGDLGMDTTDTDCVKQTYDQVRNVGGPVDDGRCDEDGGQPVEPDNTVGVDIVDQAAQFGPHGTDRPRRSKNPNARYNADKNYLGMVSATRVVWGVWLSGMPDRKLSI